MSASSNAGAPRAPRDFSVSGMIVYASGAPAAGLKIAAFDRDLRSEEALGETQSGRDGAYSVVFSERLFIERERGGADLVVKVFGADGALLVASTTLFNAPREAVIDLVIPRESGLGPSLIERMEADIAPLLGALKIAKLQEDEKEQDISFLAGETGYARADLIRLVLAHQLSTAAELRGLLARLGFARTVAPRQLLEKEFWFALFGSSGFGLFGAKTLREIAANVPNALPGLGADHVREGLMRSIARGDIPARFTDRVDAWVTAFLDFAARLSLGGEATPSFARQALEHAGVSDLEKQITFTHLTREHRPLTREFAKALEQAFGKRESDDLRTSYRLAELTRADFSLVKALKDEFKVNRPEDIPTLARQSKTEWTAFVERHKVAPPFDVSGMLADAPSSATAALTGLVLEKQFRDAFPTASFAGSLDRAMRDREVRGLRYGARLARVFEGHAEFDLARTPIDSLFEENPRGEDAAFRSELKVLQRVFKITPRFETADALIADGVRSARDAYQMGESEFVRRYSGPDGRDEDEARAGWARAANTHAAVLAIVSDLKALDPEALPAALRGSDTGFALIPNWQTLFKSGDYCHCEHCRSVLSPAAYFTDLLMFLGSRRTRTGADPETPVRDILFKRRADLGYLELNCENALKTLPYVDIVCEVLEAAVAGDDGDIELPLIAMPASDAKAATAQALAAANIQVGEDFTLSQVDPGDADRWVVHGEDATYLLKKKPSSSNFLAQVLPNSKASSAEQRAYPAYVNHNAYETLKGAIAPLELPFDLDHEEVAAAFAKSDVARWDLMSVYGGTAGPQEVDIAAAFFGISCSATPINEQRLILQKNESAAFQRDVWNSPDPDWLQHLSVVSTFLSKTRLDYEGMLALFDLQFIDPTDEIRIKHDDASCDAHTKHIENMDAPMLDRIHRFLRLWRKLPAWKMWELDLALRSPGVGNGRIDDACLIQLFYFERIRRRLGKQASVEEVCALFHDLNTETGFAGEHEKRAGALYQSLFLNRALTNSVNADFDVAKITAPTNKMILGQQEQPIVLAALGVRAADLELLCGLQDVDDASYGKLTLANLSLVWRHAFLAKRLNLTVTAWRQVTALLGQNAYRFADAKTAFEYLEHANTFLASGLNADELSWLLAANRETRAAVRDADIGRFLSDLRNEIAAIRLEYDARHYDFLEPPSDESRLEALLVLLLQRLRRDEKDARFFVDLLRDEARHERKVNLVGALAPQIIEELPIRYDAGSQTLRFTGFVDADRRTRLLTANNEAGYQAAIEGFYQTSQLALKFYEPAFSSPQLNLPADVKFSRLSDRSLAQKISYDPEERCLRFVGIMSAEEKTALAALSTEATYHSALDDLSAAPHAVISVDEQWLSEGDLVTPLRDDPSNSNLKRNIALAVKRGLAYLSRTLAERLVLQRAAALLGLSDGITRRLFTAYPQLPETLLAHLVGPFADTSGAVDADTRPVAFDGLRWAHRVAAMWARWKLTLADWERLQNLHAPAELLDFAELPVAAGDAMAPIERVLRLERLMRLQARLPSTATSLLQIMTDLASSKISSAAELAAATARLNPAWPEVDVLALTTTFEATFKPATYLRVETWERIERAFAFAARINAGTQRTSTFAARAMLPEHAQAIKGLLRAKFGDRRWTELSTEIQDALRERKRDALAAYLLNGDRPDDAPTDEWENANHLYAYYLLDVEMGASQLTSRLVQATSSVQLFVQRCFMGLERDVLVETDGPDGDAAWRWWEWMHKYRVWEANRKIFLHPENWLEPELKADRSPFFKELENELLQGELDATAVEAAFANYLQKVDAVSRLEIAGYYQEDRDGGETVLHVIGRNIGVEPHTYFHRTYDYTSWSAWTPVDADIKGDYLTPAVVGGRLYLVWPVFTEIPDEAANSAAPPPTEGMAKTWKKLKLQLSVTDNRGGRWGKTRTSKNEWWFSSSFSTPLSRDTCSFNAIDATLTDGRFGIQLDGLLAPPPTTNSTSPVVGGFGAQIGGRNAITTAEMDELETALPGTIQRFLLEDAAELLGCDGAPTPTDRFGDLRHAVRPTSESVGSSPSYLRWVEREHRVVGDALRLQIHPSLLQQGVSYVSVLEATPGRFRISPAWQLSYMDKLRHDGVTALSQTSPQAPKDIAFGAWLPFFFSDKHRTFAVFPALARESLDAQTAPAQMRGYQSVKTTFKTLAGAYRQRAEDLAEDYPLASLSPAQRAEAESRLFALTPNDELPPFDDAEFRRRLAISTTRLAHAYLGGTSLNLLRESKYHFQNFYHPLACDFAKIVQDPRKGVPALMRRETQLQQGSFSFVQTYKPLDVVIDEQIEDPDRPDWTITPGYPRDVVDFSPAGAYAQYNWELFFHAPLFIAKALSNNQQFKEARDWLHYIFNPIGVGGAGAVSPTQRYWITKPFYETSEETYLRQRIENLLRLLAGDPAAPGFPDAAPSAIAQVAYWRANPFEPHGIAAYRTVAYQKAVVMKYLDNLIAWADHLFRQDSMESINEATQLYILAAELLGPRPKQIPPQVKPSVESFNELEAQLDDFANALIEVENLIPPTSGGGASADDPPLPTLYFCIPHNEKLLGYWDKVSDRLFKIRHGMNIDGVLRQLALFEPPIDPALLVKARAAGVDIGAIAADLNAPLPLYRFQVMLQKANEVCNDVKGLGAALLSALEKRDGEALALLRQSQELRVLDAMRDIRVKQHEEASYARDALAHSKTAAEERRNFYRDVDRTSRGEREAKRAHDIGLGSDVIGAILSQASSGQKIAPTVTIGGAGWSGSPLWATLYGGGVVGDSTSEAAAAFSAFGQIAHTHANLVATQAGYDRRWEEWKLQERLAEKEIAQLEAQIAAAELRVAIAEKELQNHELQIENAKALDDFMRGKYTSEELYQWQVGQISNTYFESYRLAHDLAKRAERCMRFELGLPSSSFISYGHWDSLRKGLLSGEKLQHDLRRMESAYLEQNRREFELTKHVSLAHLDPLSLIELRETGRCRIALPEEIFDLDYPGHYFRSIASVSVTLPCVAGPYTTIACTLRLLRNSIRVNSDTGAGYPRITDDEGVPGEDARFAENNIPVKAIAMSGGQNDTGMFEFSFRDERYLPFEGAGAISEWSLELFHDNDPQLGRDLRPFDYGTISDVVMHVRYTAREDTGEFKSKAINNLRAYLERETPPQSFVILDLRRQFAGQWSKFINLQQSEHALELEISHALFPTRDVGRRLTLQSLTLLVRNDAPSDYAGVLEPGENPQIPIELAVDPRFGGLHVAEADLSGLDTEIAPSGSSLSCRLSFTSPGVGFAPSDAYLVLAYRRTS